MFGARFDDIPGGESFVLEDPIGTLVAYEIGEVVDVLKAASRAASQGRWVAGCVAFEAAPAFNESFEVHAGSRGPLAWFGVFASRRSVPFAVHDPATLASYVISQWNPALSRRTYAEAFRDVLDRICEGMASRVYLTFPLRAAFTGHLDVFYDDLVCAQRPSYAAHIWHEDLHILSVSPERFFAIDDGRITAQPMVGTGPRGRWFDEDEAHRDHLLRSEEHRAEHTLVVDLLSADLLPITSRDSIEISDELTVERFRTVWQMTSTVTAQVAGGVDLVDVFGALFPCGTVTGEPKRDSMKVIAAVEDAPRGVYTGAIGFIPPGDGINGSSFNVAIRTVEIDNAEGVASFGVGGCVMRGSESDREFDQAVTKSEVLRFDVSPMDLIEEIRWDGGYRWRADHVDRLELSAAYWSFTFDRPAIETMLDDFAQDLDVASQVQIVAQADGFVAVVSEPLPGRWAQRPGPSENPVKLALDLEPIDDRNPRRFHKTSDRRDFRVRSERHPDVDDVLLVNRAGNVTETSTANIVLLFGDTWVTPPVSDGLLGGIMRLHLLADGMIEERSVSAAEALRADAVAVVSSGSGWRPAVIADE